MTDEREKLVVHVNVEITAASLRAIVANVKKNTKCDSKGVYRVDTADKAGEIISRFLLENDFESYAKNIENYI